MTFVVSPATSPAVRPLGSSGLTCAAAQQSRRPGPSSAACSPGLWGSVDIIETLPGGCRPAGQGIYLPAATPAVVRDHQRAGTAEGYRAQAIADGIPLRPNTLFPEGDSLLQQLAARPDLHAFEKHLPGANSPYELLPEGGWVTGDAAALHGIDLRMFYSPPCSPPAGDGEHGRLLAAVRFGEGAAIGKGFYLTVHGGAVETCLDEATAELGKMEFVPFLSTVEATFRIRRPVPLHTTLMVECTITKQRGIRCWVEGRVCTAEGELLASCEVCLVDMTHFI